MVCTVCLFTACSDDDDDDNKQSLTVDNIVGTYNGAMNVSVASAPVVKDKATSISVVKSDDGVKVVLSNFSIEGVLPTPITIEAPCTVKASGDKLELKGTATVDLSALGMGELEASVSGDADGKNLTLKIDVTKMLVVVDYVGTK